MGGVYTRAVSLPPIAPPATIGILGGGQLGRMLALAARAMGYRIVVLDPIPTARPPPSPIDESSPATTTSVRRFGWRPSSDVVTYELEHVAPTSSTPSTRSCPVRPGRVPAARDPGPARGAALRRGAGVEVAPGARSGPTTTSAPQPPARAAAAAQGRDRRLRRPQPGPGGDAGELDGAIERLGRPAGDALLAEARAAFETEVSVIVARGLDGGSPTSRSRATPTTPGSSPNPWRRRRSRPMSRARGRRLGERLALAMGMVGTLTAGAVPHA